MLQHQGHVGYLRTCVDLYDIAESFDAPAMTYYVVSKLDKFVVLHNAVQQEYLLAEQLLEQQMQLLEQQMQLQELKEEDAKIKDEDADVKDEDADIKDEDADVKVEDADIKDEDAESKDQF